MRGNARSDDTLETLYIRPTRVRSYGQIYISQGLQSRSLDNLMAKELCLCIHGLMSLGFPLDLPESFNTVVYYYILIHEWNPTK